jgi:hypothetical protein
MIRFWRISYHLCKDSRDKRFTGDIDCNMDDSLAEDFVALWQSELTAMAADRELRETWTAMVTLWAGTTNAALQAMQRVKHEHPPGSPAAAQPPGAAPAAAASDSGLAQIEQLSRRVAELEQILAEFRHKRADDPERADDPA